MNGRAGTLARTGGRRYAREARVTFLSRISQIRVSNVTLLARICVLCAGLRHCEAEKGFFKVVMSVGEAEKGFFRLVYDIARSKKPDLKAAHPFWGAPL